MKKVFYFFVFATLLMAGCSKDDHEPQPPQAAIENITGVTSVAQGGFVTLSANITSSLPTTITWLVDGQTVTGATGETFEFSSNQTGEHIITLSVVNDDGTATDQITITVFYVDEPYPQLPLGVIENLSDVTLIAQGERITLNANITSSSPTVIIWTVNNGVVEGATDETFEFSSNQPGEYIITLRVVNEYGMSQDRITITVYSLIDFENVGANYLAGPTSSGENLYSDFGAGQYIGYEDPSGLKMTIIEATHWLTGELTHEFSNGGIAISRWNDMNTEGPDNECSVYYRDAETGKGGYDGSETFAVVFNGFSGINPSISFSDENAEGTFYYCWVANTTYAALSMKNGDSFSKKFELGDWFKLTVNAFDKNGNPTGTSVEFYLADFRTSTSPGIVTEWTKVDLTPLGSNVHSIKFDFDSSDAGEWGMNTPGYFCFDNLAIKN